MREIRFRGKHKVKDTWVYGNLFYGLCGAWIRQNYMEPFDTLQFYGGWTEVKPETVGQYIGLKDKKDKDIYEGDILLIDGQKYVVYWDEAMASFGLRNKHGETFPIPLPPIDGEVIGNIHDNPELIKEVEE